ncbi:MAG: hypothetical protein C4304_04835 [candidate division GAL15 bacterium]
MRPELLVETARRRLAWQRALQAAETAALGVMAAGLAAQVGTLMLPYSIRPEAVFATATAAALLLALAVRLGAARNAWEAAHWLDWRCGLQDRLATYLAIRSGVRSQLMDHFLQDVQRAVQHVQLRSAIPLRPLRFRALLAVAGGLVAWDLLVSGATLPNTPARRVAEVVRQEGRRLQELAEQWEQEARTRGLRETLKSAQSVHTVGGALASPRATAELARQHLSRLTAELRQARARLQARAREQGVTGPGGVQLPPEVAKAMERELNRLGRALEEVALSAAQAEHLRRMLGQLEANAPLHPRSPIRKALQEAQRGLGQHDRVRAREGVLRAQEAFRELARLLQEENALATHQQEVEASGLSIHQALQPGGDPEAAQERPVSYPAMPRQRAGAPASRGDPEAWLEEGSQYGLGPGTGHLSDKMGSPTPRLQGQRRHEQLHGDVGEGKVYAGRLEGPGLVAPPRTRLAAVSPRVVRQADEAVRAQRVPAPYREWVLRYFTRLQR